MWTQISGTTVTLSDTTAIQPTFTSPSVETSIMFELEVTNSSGLKNSDDVTIIVSSEITTSLKPCYQFYNPIWIDHHFTIDEAEVATIKANPQWGYDYIGISWYAYETMGGAGFVVPDEFELKPCYQFYNPTRVDHHFTIDEDEVATINANPQWGYDYIGISWYAYGKKEGTGSGLSIEDFELKPCYQFYNPTYVDHHFTIYEDEVAMIKANPQWEYEYIGISWYAYKKKSE